MQNKCLQGEQRTNILIKASGKAVLSQANFYESLLAPAQAANVGF